jgi:hypothetical protein
VANAITPINQSLAMGETNDLELVVMQNGVKVLVCLCGEGIWQIECCPLKSNTHCLALQFFFKNK